ncbi:hypothetical protein VKT23_011458 [Stygiomarasmius scandens]|uniref:Alpha/beta hydrolase fold-3 domain-containing protein n=1 Tax=Marasmiellus scandens TaxID=2682957 RepID=A0ABR1J932_9AGAR
MMTTECPQSQLPEVGGWIPSLTFTRSDMNLTTRTDLSFLYKILRILIRPIRPHLVGVGKGKPYPAGSPNLNPPKTKCSIRHRQVEGMNLYDFYCSTSNSSDPGSAKHSHSHRVFYFAGGGFQSPPSKEHWVFCSELCRRSSGMFHITLVSYPLAPNTPAPESLSALFKWFSTTCAESVQVNEHITLMGDSSGGNIALALAFWWTGQLAEPDGSPLKSVLVMSPPTDLRNQNPSIKEADRYDPILSIPLTTNVAKTWAGSKWTLDRPELSPNLFEDSSFRKIRDSGVKVHGVVGTYDVLAPDAMVFYERCRDNEVEGEWLEWKGQMHCFPLTWMYRLPEGEAGLQWIVNLLKHA